jgi:hypothetical protein
MLVTFSSLRETIEEDILILAHSLRGFSPWLADFIPLAQGEEKHHGGAGMIEQSCSLHDSQEAERLRGRVQGQGLPFTACPQ